MELGAWSLEDLFYKAWNMLGGIKPYKIKLLVLQVSASQTKHQVRAIYQNDSSMKAKVTAIQCT